ncbi:MAG TPA: CsbD family protein [Pyrinomonadaceae bacterium]
MADEPNRDQTAGQVEQEAGEMKETVGAATGDHQLEREGKLDQIGGAAREEDGDRKADAAESLGDDLKELRDAINE